MKYFVALTLFLVGTSAQPQERVAERLITDQIVAGLEEVSETIKEAGLDPLHIKREAAAYALPVPVIFNAAGFVEEFLFTGLSDIIIKHINYSTLAFRLTLEVELPHIHVSAGALLGEATVFDNKLTGEGFGSVDIRGLRVFLDIRVGILGGVTIRSIKVDSSLQSIDSDLNLNLLGYDISNEVNTFLGEIIPKTHADFKREIDELISIILIKYINKNVLG